jgi:disulfide bond formation protein DsbB
MYIALAAAWVATCGSLYMSLVLGWKPCEWCWYQRILMYPIALILTLGLLKQQRDIAHYALLLAVPGMAASTYHVLLQKVPSIAVLHPCDPNAPCTGDFLYQLGTPPFLTIPMLAWVAFAIIIVCALLSLPKPQLETATSLAGPSNFEQPKPLLSPQIRTALVAIPIIALFGISGVLQNANKPPPFAAIAPVADSGAALYESACQSCHQANAGNIRKTFMQKSDFELLAFMQKGRSALESEQGTGQEMPKRGGRADLTDEHLLAIIRYVRMLKQ